MQCFQAHHHLRECLCTQLVTGSEPQARSTGIPVKFLSTLGHKELSWQAVPAPDDAFWVLNLVSAACTCLQAGCEKACVSPGAESVATRLLLSEHE